MQIDPTTLHAIEQALHSVIRLRAGQYVEKYALALPQLAKVLDGSEAIFRVPGMGYFRYQLLQQAGLLSLVVESKYTAISGSGQRHRITAMGASLIEEGF